MTDKERRKLIDATELIQQLSVDPVKCPGCPEPEFLPELIDVLEAAPAVDVYGMNGWCKEIPGGDSISRAAAIDVLDVGAELLRRVLDDTDIVGAEREKYKWGLELIESCISDMKELPSAQSSDEYNRRWHDGREALREEMWEDGRDRLN